MSLVSTRQRRCWRRMIWPVDAARIVHSFRMRPLIMAGRLRQDCSALGILLNNGETNGRSHRCFIMHKEIDEKRGQSMKPINVQQYEALAQVRIEPGAWAFYSSGADDEVTLRA